MIIRIASCLIFICIVFTANGQDTDSIADAVDSTFSGFDNDEEARFYAAPDSAGINPRAFDEQKIRELKADRDLDYKQLPTVGESLWDRIMRWLAEFIDSFFRTAYETNWGRVLLYAFGIALIIVIVMMVLKVDAFKMFFSRAGAANKFEVLEENIHEMNFDALIQEAIDQQNYRKAIRLLFLFSLKLLSDRQLISWESGKTNHDYVGELTQPELKTRLNELSYYFDYAWYGNFHVNRETFDKVSAEFQNLKSKL